MVVAFLRPHALEQLSRIPAARAPGRTAPRLLGGRVHVPVLPRLKLGLDVALERAELDEHPGLERHQVGVPAVLPIADFSEILDGH